MSAAGRILQFAKAPLPGRVKSRLATALGTEGAAEVARVLTERVAAGLTALPAGWDPVLCADMPGDPALQAIAARHARVLWPQGEGDLGQRMGRCVARALAASRAAIVIGSDCTGYDSTYLRHAIRILESGTDAVLGPAVDGGYVLIGFRRWVPGAMDGIAWGSPTVADAQRRRFAAAGLGWEELPPRADVDRPEDLWMLGRAPGIRRW